MNLRYAVVYVIATLTTLRSNFKSEKKITANNVVDKFRILLSTYNRDRKAYHALHQWNKIHTFVRQIKSDSNDNFIEVKSQK